LVFLESGVAVDVVVERVQPAIVSLAWKIRPPEQFGIFA
jgi:hypothetical protein